MRQKPQTIAFWRGQLPHWEVADGRYFITVHLHGAIPRAGAEQVRDLAARLNAAVQNGQDGLRLRRLLFREMERWLDTSPPVTDLVQPAVAQVVVDALHQREQLRIWQVYHYVLMPSHLHLFLKLLKGRLKPAISSFKEWTGKRALPLLQVPRQRFWQAEWFDHWSRSADEDTRIDAYIRDNPVRAGLVDSPSKWPYGSWSERSVQRDSMPW